MKRGGLSQSFKAPPQFASRSSEYFETRLGLTTTRLLKVRSDVPAMSLPGPHLPSSAPDLRRLYLGVLVIQPSPFCNINCDYCYLPHRTSTQRMAFSTIERSMARVAESGLVGPEITLLWHAGEPLAVPISWYEEAFGIIDQFPELRGKVRHNFQSNGTLLNDKWCEFIKAHPADIGLSIDGPEHIHDRHRVTRSGQGTHAKAERGAKILQQHDIPFGVVAVISQDSLDHADEIYRYFVDLGIKGVGFNTEEVEGVNEQSSLGDDSEDRVRAFLQRIFDLNQGDDFPLHIREFDNAFEALLTPEVNRTPDGRHYNLETEALAMINVDCFGNFSTFSPELLGQETRKYESFTFGNVVKNSFFDATGNPHFQRVVADIDAGNRKCAASCPYWENCGGASPSNKYYENGTFDSAETHHCRSMIQMPIDIVRNFLAKHPPRTVATRETSTPR